MCSISERKKKEKKKHFLKKYKINYLEMLLIIKI